MIALPLAVDNAAWVTLQARPAKECHCERSEAISCHSRENGNPEGASPCAPTLGLLVGPASETVSEFRSLRQSCHDINAEMDPSRRRNANAIRDGSRQP